jgi:hypothetical protein
MATKTSTPRLPAANAVFEIRNLDVIIRKFRASRPNDTLNELDTAAGRQQHVDCIAAWSFDPIGTSDSSVVYQVEHPLQWSREVLKDPKVFVDYCRFHGSVGTWNANGEGQWLAEPGKWILVDVELVQEQADGSDDYDDEGGGGGNYVSVTFALWKVKEGWLAAVWEPSKHAVLAKLIGFKTWPKKGWQPCKVWYGE